MPAPVRILIVDDSAFIRRALERMLEALPTIRIVGTGTNGREAIELARELRPDVIIMDVNMPEVDGLEALRRIMAEQPTPVLVVSTLTQEGAEITMQALELGAVDFIDKGSVGTAMDIYELAPLLREKVLGVARASPHAHSAPAEPAATAPVPNREVVPAIGRYEVVAIGASTGGPGALSELLPALPRGFPAGVLVAQHMPAGFTETLAERLNRRSAVSVREARDGDAVEPGQVLIAPGKMQMTLERKNGALRVRIAEDSEQRLHQPSVDLLFASAARALASRVVGVVLTGMGNDGTAGLEALHRAGARTIVEAPETAVIYGMPRAARPFADEVLPLRRIAGYLVELCSAGSAPAPGEH